MSLIILDFGSGNTCRNDVYAISDMIAALAKVDSRRHGHKIVIKWQLFEKAGDNIPLDRDNFWTFYQSAKESGYETTASVFDIPSLKFLLQFNDLPFIKIANRRDLDYLIGLIPRQIPAIISVGPGTMTNMPYRENVKELFCVSKYPASIEDYEPYMHRINGLSGISDHTTDFELWNIYKPEIIEWHYKLSHQTGLDAGPFARTPEQLIEIIG
ncbi:MAG: N-acetylneuraminate synthase family protein [Patescibacteria group bacterium]